MPKACKKEDVIENRAEVKAMETNKIIQRINESKSWFFERLNKTDKHLANLTEKRKDSNPCNKGEIITDHTEIQQIINTYFKKMNSGKMENTKEMYRFLHIYELQKLSQEDIKFLNSPNCNWWNWTCN